MSKERKEMKCKNALLVMTGIIIGLGMANLLLLIQKV